MTGFTVVWNAGYEGLPPDTESEGQGATRIRDLKVQLRLRLQVDHAWAGTGNDGYHTQVTLLSQQSDLPVAPVVNDGTFTQGGLLYSKTVNGNAELCYRDSIGNVLQLTNTGNLGGLPSSSVPAGSKMIFRQGTAPPGWTQDVSVNDQVIRFVNGNSVGQGGNWVISGCTVQNHTLVPAEAPVMTGSCTAALGGSPGANSGSGGGPFGNTTITVTVNPGGGGPHAHPFTSDGSWRPAYADVILATKN